MFSITLIFPARVVGQETWVLASLLSTAYSYELRALALSWLTVALEICDS